MEVMSIIYVLTEDTIGGIYMKEIPLKDQFDFIGGTSIKTIIVYTLLKAGLYKIIKSTSGKIFIPKIISAQWKS